jgi:hypothetical protein
MLVSSKVAVSTKMPANGQGLVFLGDLKNVCPELLLNL